MFHFIYKHHWLILLIAVPFIGGGVPCKASPSEIEEDIEDIIAARHPQQTAIEKKNSIKGKEKAEDPKLGDLFQSYPYPIPNEVLSCIFKNINKPEELTRLRLVSHPFKSLAEDYLETINDLNKDVCFQEKSQVFYTKKPVMIIRNFVPSMPEIDKISEFVRKSTTLTSLSLINTRLDEDRIDYLVDGLKRNESITLLDLSRNNIDDKGIQILSHFIEKSKNLVDLNLAHNNIEYQGIQSLSKAIKGKKNISLNISHNSLADSGLSDLVSVVEYDNTSFIKLNLSHCHLTRHAPEYIARLLRTKSIHSLDISDNELTPEIIRTIARPLSSNTTLIDLNLEKNSIGSYGSDAVSSMYYEFQYLRKNSALTTLNLANNDFGDEDANAIARMLSKNLGLKNLNLSHNRITNEGADFIALSLKHNTTLFSLDLSNNSITSDCINEFKRIMKNYNTTLTSIIFTHNDENSISIEKLQNVLNGKNVLSVKGILRNFKVEKKSEPEQNITFTEQAVLHLLQDHRPLPLTENAIKLAHILLDKEKSLRLAADLGHSESQCKLASSILYSDTETSKKYILGAAAQGHPDALHKLSVAYETAPYYFGLGKRSPELAYSLCKEAAKRQHKEAQLSLALAYLEGSYNLKIDEDEGMNMLQKLSDEGNMLAKGALLALASEEISDEDETSTEEED